MVSLHRVIPLVDSLAFVGLVQVALLHQAKQIDLLLLPLQVDIPLQEIEPLSLFWFPRVLRVLLGI